MTNSTITITVGDQAENHVGMQKIGELSDNGFDLNDLEKIATNFENNKLIELKNYCNDKFNPEPAYVLVLENGLSKYCNPDDFYNEQLNLKWDNKALMYGRVVNKYARYNLCFGNISQEPDYESGKGRIINLNTVPILNNVMNEINLLIPGKTNNLVAEGNYYYDINKCGIGYHGDAERRKVIGIRVGKSLPLVFQWYNNNEKISESIIINLNHGDMYIMSEKATGYDWKKKKISTLRHAAGCSKYTGI